MRFFRETRGRGKELGILILPSKRVPEGHLKGVSDPLGVSTL